MTQALRRRHHLAALVLASLLLGAACGVRMKSGGEPAGPASGGVYRSENQGASWQQVVLVERTDQRTVTIAHLGIEQLRLLPGDSQHLYALAGAGGLYETLDAGASWQQVYPGAVQALTLHPTKTGTLYLASGNRILRSEDGGREWKTVYLEPTPQVVVADLELVAQNPATVYAITNRGVLLRSDNEGTTWRKVYFFKQVVARLFVNQRSPRILYVAQPNGTLWRSADGGETWIDATQALREQLKVPLKLFRALAFTPATTDGLLYANQHGLYRTQDGGVTWEEVKIVTAPAAVMISALAVNPQRAGDIYYATATAFYRSTNAGTTWSTVALPAQLVPSTLIHHPTDGKTLYLGFSR